MPSSFDPSMLESLQSEIQELLGQVHTMKHGALIQQALMTLVRMAEVEADRLDWKILNASLQDMEKAFRVFYPYRHVRKVTIFGSARMPSESAEYQMAVDFARCITAAGFMVITGAGPGIMQAGNEGAGAEKSFGLNIQLPFEQGSNPFMEGDPKLVEFKYFFTRKLFFIRETDALALFPGGFGTQDEAFESITLMQTGKSDLLPLVLIDQPGGDYWLNWDHYVRQNLLKAGLISPDDLNLYTITDSVEVACKAIAGFYKVFHSSRYMGEQLVLRLTCELSDEAVELLNQEFNDILISGRIEKGSPYLQDSKPDLAKLPKLLLHFDQRSLGRLYQMIRTINTLADSPGKTNHPEQK